MKNHFRYLLLEITRKHHAEVYFCKVAELPLQNHLEKGSVATQLYEILLLKKFILRIIQKHFYGFLIMKGLDTVSEMQNKKQAKQ